MAYPSFSRHRLAKMVKHISFASAPEYLATSPSGYVEVAVNVDSGESASEMHSDDGFGDYGYRRAASPWEDLDYLCEKTRLEHGMERGGGWQRRNHLYVHARITTRFRW